MKQHNHYTILYISGDNHNQLTGSDPAITTTPLLVMTQLATSTNIGGTPAAVSPTAAGARSPGN